MNCYFTYIPTVSVIYGWRSNVQLSPTIVPISNVEFIKKEQKEEQEDELQRRTQGSVFSS